MKQQIKLNSAGVAAAVLGLMAAGAGTAQAGAPEGAWYVAPEALWLLPDSKFHSQDDVGYRIAIGKSLTENWDAEIGYTDTQHNPKDSRPGRKLDLPYSELDFKRLFNRSERVNPFIDLGIGALNSRVSGIPGSGHTDVAGKIGLGALVALDSPSLSRIQLIADAGLRVDAAKGVSSAIDPYVGLGFRINLGGHAPVAPPPVVAAPPPPAPAAEPPPAPLPVAAAPPPPPVDVDSDGDGVPDRLDKCPNTPRGDKVDANGCSLTMRLEVNFASDSATILPDSQAELDRFVTFLRDVPSARGSLEGHTDSTGTPAHNQTLSERRAESVKAYVVGKGIDGSRLETHGYGQTRPIADNKTKDGRARNRRVQFVRPDGSN